MPSEKIRKQTTITQEANFTPAQCYTADWDLLSQTSTLVHSSDTTIKFLSCNTLQDLLQWIEDMPNTTEEFTVHTLPSLTPAHLLLQNTRVITDYRHGETSNHVASNRVVPPRQMQMGQYHNQQHLMASSRNRPPTPYRTKVQNQHTIHPSMATSEYLSF
jgi:hypothetical protein